MQDVLRPTYWFDTGQDGDEPYSLTVSFSGQRIGTTKSKGRPGDRFLQEQTVEGIPPGSGPAAVTTEVRGVKAGEWAVVAAPVRRLGDSRLASPYSPSEDGGESGRRPLWPRRVQPLSGRSQTFETMTAALASSPGQHALWGPLVILGVIVGAALQALLLARGSENVGAAMTASLLAVFAGWVGAKGWYVAVQQGKRFDGWCIQGAILGGAVAVAIVFATGLEVSAGPYLNAIAPGLMFGLAIGRPGCFLAGCCVGRPTRSRWGVWSTDRFLGIRRVPTQLLESLLSLVIAILSLIVVLVAGLGSSGGLLVGVLAAYTLGRQLILPYRVEARQTSLGRPLTIALAVVALIGAVLISMLG